MEAAKGETHFAQPLFRPSGFSPPHLFVLAVVDPPGMLRFVTIIVIGGDFIDSHVRFGDGVRVHEGPVRRAWLVFALLGFLGL